MRVFALSDLHVDFEENSRWIEGLSNFEFVTDVLILAGDISHISLRLAKCFELLKKKFSEVFFVPGNHELWIDSGEPLNSREKFFAVLALARSVEVRTVRVELDGLVICPLYSWYDFSFGMPSEYLLQAWMDFRMCVWPNELHDAESISNYFLSLNEVMPNISGKPLITFSHFLPRIDLMPATIPESKRRIFPVLGAKKIDQQIRELESTVHIYGHSHVNRDIELDGVRYVNNAFGYPGEERIARKRLLQIV